MLRTSDITSGSIDWATVPYCTEEPEVPDKYLVREGDILISRAGSVGASHLVTHVEPAVFASYLIRFQPNDDVSAKYVAYFLCSPIYWRQIADNTAGIAVPNVNASKLERIVLPLAPRGEQDEIVAEIEKQLSRLDEAVAIIRSAKTRLYAYRASVLSAVQTGALCGIDCGNWPTRSIGELATKVQYGSSAKTSATKKEMPVLRMGNIENGELALDDLKYLPADYDEFPALLLETGDLLFNRTNSPELVGKVAIYKGNPTPCSFASYLIRVRFIKEIAPEFVAYVLNSAFGRAWVRSVVSQQVGQANVNGSKLKAFQFRVPPLDLQRELVAEAERHLSLIQQSDAQLSAVALRSVRLRSRLLARAFGSNPEALM